MKYSVSVVMALIMSNIPNIAMAEFSDEMISTASVVEQLSRVDAEKRVMDAVNIAEVRAKLEKMGVTPDEISGKLASLSDSELRQMAGQMEEARYGGDAIVGVLVIVVLVLLIIYLAKRI